MTGGPSRSLDLSFVGPVRGGLSCLTVDEVSGVVVNGPRLQSQCGRKQTKEPRRFNGPESSEVQQAPTAWEHARSLG